MLRDVTFFELEILDQLSRASSLRALARERKLEPAHLSKVLKRLETKSGVALFQRSTTGIALTPEGREFLLTAQRVLEAARALEPRARGVELRPREAVTIGAPSYINTHVLPGALTAAGREHLGIRFRLLDTVPDQAANLGVRGAFDLAIHFGQATFTRAWTTRRIGELTSALFARPAHPLAPTALARDLQRYPMIAPAYLTGGHIRFGQDGCPLPKSLRLPGDEVTTAESALRLVQRSDQLMFIPRIVAAASVLRGEIAEIRVPEWPEVRHEVYLSVRSDAVSQRLANSLIAALKRALE